MPRINCLVGMVPVPISSNNCDRKTAATAVKRHQIAFSHFAVKRLQFSSTKDSSRNATANTTPCFTAFCSRHNAMQITVKL
ncbi:MAG: hypothetical protein IIX85_08475, partial [Clostridia bacterium]|nr:hypothetical protein [Clostridia bacterium]